MAARACRRCDATYIRAYTAPPRPEPLPYAGVLLRVLQLVMLSPPPPGENKAPGVPALEPPLPAPPPQQQQVQPEPEPEPVTAEEHGRWRYAVVVNTCGQPLGSCRCGFGLRSAPSIDASRTGEVALNGEEVLVVERRRCRQGWVFLRTQKGGWLPEQNLLVGCEVCREIADLLRQPSAEDNAAAERSTPQGRWCQWLADAGVELGGGVDHTMRLELTSRWTYRRGASAPLSAEQAEYWLQGDRWQYCADEPDASCRGDYEVQYAGDEEDTSSPSPQQVCPDLRP
jgi:hypothetical protein